MFTVGCKLFKPLTQNQELPKHFICVSNSFPFHIATNYAVYSGDLRTFFIGSLTKFKRASLRSSSWFLENKNTNRRFSLHMQQTDYHFPFLYLYHEQDKANGSQLDKHALQVMSKDPYNA